MITLDASEGINEITIVNNEGRKLHAERRMEVRTSLAELLPQIEDGKSFDINEMAFQLLEEKKRARRKKPSTIRVPVIPDADSLLEIADEDDLNDPSAEDLMAIEAGKEVEPDVTEPASEEDVETENSASDSDNEVDDDLPDYDLDDNEENFYESEDFPPGGISNILDAFKHGFFDFEIEEIDPETYSSTTARPGTDEKLGVIAERARLGLPLWHPEDRIDYGPSD